MDLSSYVSKELYKALYKGAKYTDQGTSLEDKVFIPTSDKIKESKEK